MWKIFDLSDPVSRARLFRYAWFISLGMMILGIILIAYFWDTGI